MPKVVVVGYLPEESRVNLEVFVRESSLRAPHLISDPRQADCGLEPAPAFERGHEAADEVEGATSLSR